MKSRIQSTVNVKYVSLILKIWNTINFLYWECKGVGLQYRNQRVHLPLHVIFCRISWFCYMMYMCFHTSSAIVLWIFKLVVIPFRQLTLPFYCGWNKIICIRLCVTYKQIYTHLKCELAQVEYSYAYNCAWGLTFESTGPFLPISMIHFRIIWPKVEHNYPC